MRYMSPWDFMSLLESADPGIVAVDEVMPRSIMERALFDGFGVVLNKSVKVHKWFYTKSRKVFEKRGVIVIVSGAPFKLLEESSGDVFYFVLRMHVGGVSSSFDEIERVGVLHAEFAKRPRNIKSRFEPFKVYRGEVHYGKRAYSTKWMIWVPTYEARDALVLCHPDDLVPLSNLFYKYKHMKYGNRVIALNSYTAVPLFSYKRIRELLTSYK